MRVFCVALDCFTLFDREPLPYPFGFLGCQVQCRLTEQEVPSEQGYGCSIHSCVPSVWHIVGVLAEWLHASKIIQRVWFLVAATGLVQVAFIAGISGEGGQGLGIC